MANFFFSELKRNIQAQCGKMNNLLSPEEYFVKSTIQYLIPLGKTLFSRNFCQNKFERKFLEFLHCEISSNQLFNNSFSKNVNFTKFFVKKELRCGNYGTHVVIHEMLSHDFLRNINFFREINTIIRYCRVDM